MFDMASVGPRSTFLVSGGGRGVTAACIVGLARRFGCRFILVGRTASPDDAPSWATVSSCTDDRQLPMRAALALAAAGAPASPRAIRELVESVRRQREVAATLRAIHKAGGSAEYVCADLADADLLRERLRAPLARLGPVTGLIHGAGAGVGVGAASDARTLPDHLTPASFDATFATRVQGLHHLLLCVPPAQLDALILMTTAASFFGSADQAAGAVADEMLRKVGHRLARAHPTCRVVVFNWGPWTRHEADGRAWGSRLPDDQFGGGAVPPEPTPNWAIPVAGGVQTLVDALAGTQTSVQVLVGRAPPIPRVPAGGPLRSYRLRRHLTAEANPFLGASRGGGQHDRVGEDDTSGDDAGGVAWGTVLPASCALAWFASAAEGLNPGYRFVAGTDVRILHDIRVDERRSDEYVLIIEETHKDDQVIDVTAVIRGNGTTRLDGQVREDRCHYAACLELRTAIPEPPVYLDADLSERDGLDGSRLYRDGMVVRAVAFQGVERVLNASQERVTLRAVSPRISERDQGQFPVQACNPFVADVQLQSLLIWAHHVLSVADVVLTSWRAEQYRSVPPGEAFYVSLVVRARTATTLLADIASHDAHGRVYLRFSDVRAVLQARAQPACDVPGAE